MEVLEILCYGLGTGQSSLGYGSGSTCRILGRDQVGSGFQVLLRMFDAKIGLGYIRRYLPT